MWAGCHFSQLRGSQKQHKMLEMLSKNKGTVGGTVMDTFFCCRLLKFGVLPETLVTMELKIDLEAHKGQRRRTKIQRETPSETPCPLSPVQKSICLETCGKAKSCFSCGRGATFLNFEGHKNNRKC